MTFRNENEYLIHLLCCALNGTVPEDVPEHISLENVFAIGKTHEVANIAYPAISKSGRPVSDALMAQWREFYYKAVKRDAAQKKAREEIVSVLHAEGIYTLEVQGTKVKQFYPQSHMRMMSDLDFIIPADSLDKTAQIMRSIGYDVEAVHDNTEIQASKNQLYIELHTEFFYFKADKSVFEVLNNPFSLAMLHDDYSAEVDDSVFYLFHLLHTIKHYQKKGCGIRRIIDLYYLENALKDRADYDYINDVLRQHGLYEVKESLLAVMNHWFNGAEPQNDISMFEKDIFEAGNHGTDEQFYRHKFTNWQLEGKHFVKLRFFLSFIFPSKEDIYDSYPFCREHNYPIVLCWIHRWIFSVFNAKKWKSVKKLFSRLRIKIS